MHAVDQIFNDEDFSDQDLQDARFERCSFYHCRFNHADLTDAEFIQCKFIVPGEDEGCDFSYATLTSASFKHCNLSMALFKGARCYGLEMRECNLQGSDFSRASFANYITPKSYFCSAYITACNLAYADLSELLLEECELFDNRWRGANLTGASMKGSDLSGGEFSPEQWGSFELKGANLTRIELDGLDPRVVELDGVMINQWQQEQLLAPLGLIVTPD
ncbi:Qnr family pentapeptide repeat protein [Shewanella pealeana]|uniref:Pentapeptide repeat protein n=1 Tax=Shewanella pealeana (strain ATCC 700345 / ANG-SQ1) TaxID=398579 RepID=A8H8W6_SHEPA|nr:Qnr family pentapeptide repeat protein [Shewanella pealeana]ABV89003.1 pentapeptide repeat protein [Shewanella pealeana ATCC 700345]